jgi:hypothetical protein
MLLKRCTIGSYHLKKASPACDSSRRIAVETIKPKTPEKAPKIKYKVPIFLWLVENSHLTTHGFVKKATKV